MTPDGRCGKHSLCFFPPPRDPPEQLEIVRQLDRLRAIGWPIRLYAARAPAPLSYILIADGKSKLEFCTAAHSRVT